MDRGRAYLVEAVRADFTVSITSTVCEIPAITLDPGGSPRQDGGMSPALSRGTDAGAVAGRIDGPSPRTLSEAVDRWQDSLRARGRRPRTIDAYKRTVDAWAKAGRHRWVHDLTYEHVEAWMAWKRAEGQWSGTSYNHALAAFRSLTRYLTRLGWLSRDPMVDADRANVDEAPGARVATADEVAAVIGQALLRQADGRSRGFRALYWASMAFTGARYSEPARWEWRDLDLESDIPTLAWRPEIQKVAKRAVLAIHPRLAELLRAWKAEARGDLVFPRQATRPAFKDDAARAGVNVDGFSPHSFRKAFETILVNRGVPSRLVDILMRHSLGVQGAYYRPSLEAQAAALSKYPDVWTLKILGSPTKESRSAEKCGSLPVSTPMNTHPTQLAEPGTSRSVGVESDQRPGAGLSALKASNGSPSRSDSLIGVGDLLKQADPTAVADLLRAVARVIDGR